MTHPLDVAAALAPLTDASAPLMIDLLAYIEQHIGEPELGTETLQQAFALSRASLYRLFHSRGGVASYIREQRLCTAYRYLQAFPECSLTWLLYEMGFASERQFQRAFQQRFGMPPMQWRRQCRAAPQRRTPARRGHYMPMWRFIRELGQDLPIDPSLRNGSVNATQPAPLLPAQAQRRLGQPLRPQPALDYAEA
nr:transcriptional regulator TagK [Xanthomonas maliensis]